MPLFGPSIEKLKKNRNVKELIKILDHKDPIARASAAQALGIIGEPEAVIPLVTMLVDSQPTVRQTAIAALHQMGVDIVEVLTDLAENDRASVRQFAARALGEVGVAGGINILVALLADRQEAVSRGAFDTLVQLGRNAVEALIDGLASRRKAVRLRAMVALERIEDARAVGPLLQALVNESEDPRLRERAAKALAALYHCGCLSEEQKQLILAQHDDLKQQHTDAEELHRFHQDAVDFRCVHTDIHPGLAHTDEGLIIRL